MYEISSNLKVLKNIAPPSGLAGCRRPIRASHFGGRYSWSNRSCWDDGNRMHSINRNIKETLHLNGCFKVTAVVLLRCPKEFRLRINICYQS